MEIDYQVIETEDCDSHGKYPRRVQIMGLAPTKLFMFYPQLSN